MTRSSTRTQAACLKSVEAEREHWGRVHIQGDRNPPIHLSSERRDFWKPLWEERALEGKKR